MKHMTTIEYLNTPETANPQELIYGVLRAADAPAPSHQAAVGDLFLALAIHVREQQLGDVWLSPIDVILDEARALVVQPDLLFISNERGEIVGDRIRGAPDLVVEVLSPNPRIGSLDERIAWFARYGVRECWLLHQFARRLEVLVFASERVVERRLFDEGDPIRSTVLPGFQRTLGSILRWAS
jgi:Uma2 family endonuclease